MHSIMFGISIFTVQLLIVGYRIFYEMNVAHKETTMLINNAFDWETWEPIGTVIFINVIVMVTLLMKPRI